MMNTLISQLKEWEQKIEMSLKLDSVVGYNRVEEVLRD